MAETVFGFRKDDASKLIDLIGGGGGLGDSSKSDLIPDSGPLVFLAYTTSTITARSGTTVGSGTATIKRIDTTTLADHPATPISVTVYNIATTAVASGKYIAINREYASGKWFVMLEDCG